MTQSGTQRATSPVSNLEFQNWRLTERAQQHLDTIRIAFDVLLNEVKEVIPDSRYLSLVKTDLERACMTAIKGIAAQKGNQE